MARFDGKIEAAGEARIEATELLAALGEPANSEDHTRRQAIACLLSASKGWEAARDKARGAFASAPTPTWLMDDKD